MLYITLITLDSGETRTGRLPGRPVVVDVALNVFNAALCYVNRVEACAKAGREVENK